MGPGQQHDEVLLSPHDNRTKIEYETEYRKFKKALERESASRISRNRVLKEVVEVNKSHFLRILLLFQSILSNYKFAVR